jgi:ATP-dependent Lon protease
VSLVLSKLKSVLLHVQKSCSDWMKTDSEAEALMRTVFTQFDQYVKLNKKIPPEILTSLATIDEAGRLADTIAAHFTLKLEEKQKTLEMFDVSLSDLEHLLYLMEVRD